MPESELKLKHLHMQHYAINTLYNNDKDKNNLNQHILKVSCVYMYVQKTKQQHLTMKHLVVRLVRFRSIF